MYYIKSKPNDNGNYGNPTSNKFDNSVALPDELLADFIKYKGFVTLVIEEDKVISLDVNQEALDNYLSVYPSVEETPEPTVDEIINALLGVSE